MSRVTIVQVIDPTHEMYGRKLKVCEKTETEVQVRALYSSDVYTLTNAQYEKLFI